MTSEQEQIQILLKSLEDKKKEDVETLLNILVSNHKENASIIKKHQDYIDRSNFTQYDSIYDIVADPITFNKKAEIVIPILEEIYSGHMITVDDFNNLDQFYTWLHTENIGLRTLIKKASDFQLEQQPSLKPAILEKHQEHKKQELADADWKKKQDKLKAHDVRQTESQERQYISKARKTISSKQTPVVTKPKIKTKSTMASKLGECTIL